MEDADYLRREYEIERKIERDLEETHTNLLRVIAWGEAPENQAFLSLIRDGCFSRELADSAMREAIDRDLSITY